MMTIDREKLLHYSMLIAVTLVYMVITVMYTVYPFNREDTRFWKGYYTVLVEKQTPIERVHSLLRKQGFTTIIHEKNTYLDFFSYSDYEQVSVSKLYERLDSLDSRIDPYMKNIKNYFHVKGEQEFNVFYVQDDRAPLKFYLAVNSSLRKSVGEWYVAEFNLFQNTVPIILFMLFAGFIILCEKKHRLFLSLAAIPWLLIIINGNLYFFGIACFLFLGFTLLYTELIGIVKYFLNYRALEFRSGDFVQKLLAFGLSFCAALVLSSASPHFFQYMLFILLGVFADMCIVCIAVLRMVQKQEKQEHRLFYRVSILPKKIGFKISLNGIRSVFLVYVLLLAAPLIMVLTTPHRELEVPAAKPVSTITDFDWDSLRALSLYDSSLYPTIADYISHFAYQTGYLYSVKYRFPNKGEVVTLSSYRLGEKGIEKNQKIVANFTEPWFTQVLNVAGKQGITKLLLDQDTPVTVTNEKIHGIHMSNTYIVLYAILSLLMISPMVVLNYYLTPQNMYGMKSLLLRRKSQAA